MFRALLQRELPELGLNLLQYHLAARLQLLNSKSMPHSQEDQIVFRALLQRALPELGLNLLQYHLAATPQLLNSQSMPHSQEDQIVFRALLQRELPELGLHLLHCHLTALEKKCFKVRACHIHRWTKSRLGRCCSGSCQSWAIICTCWEQTCPAACLCSGSFACS